MWRLHVRWILEPGRAWLLGALLAAILIYAPALGYGIVKYDDAWLVRDNWVLQTPSWRSIAIIFFDLHSPARYTLAPEYLPIRDLSVMLDFVLWGSRWSGFHLTNLLLYLTAIGAWFALLTEFGVDRRLAGLALLVWAVHPVHAESVAWLAERKGLLGMTFSGVAGACYARFRRGGSAAWLCGAVLAAPCAVWSKAHAAFALASLAALELALPARRVSSRRSLLGLGAIGAVGLAAFLPVVALAAASDVVGSEMRAPAGRVAMVLGTHGFYLRLAAAALKNAPSYPISVFGPTWIEVVSGAAGLLLLLAIAVVPSRRIAPELRAAAVVWLCGWLPVSHLILPLQMIYVADRYLLLPSIGLALGVAFLVQRMPHAGLRWAALAAVVVFGAVRAADARSSFRGPIELWARAVESNPADGAAWSMYAEALADSGRADLAAKAVDAGLGHSRHPRLILRQALLLIADGDRARGRDAMREAALAGEPRAMSNHALLLMEEGELDGALDWARRGAAAMQMYAPAQRALGRVALRSGNRDEALRAFTRAFELEPQACTNRFNLALVELELEHMDAARHHVVECADDARLGAQARAMLAEIARRTRR